MGALPDVVLNQSSVRPALKGGPVLNSVVTPGLTLTAAAQNGSPAIANEFWATPDLELVRWSRLYPYQLLVVRARKQADGSTAHSPEPGWVYTLPVPPESYSVAMPTAVTVAATLGGVVEEHNGAPFRVITVRGTTGVLPARGAAPQQLGFSAVEAIAGGTLTALQGAAAALHDPAANPNVHTAEDFADSRKADSDDAGVTAKTSGYYQFHLLARFLEAYLAVKKTKAGRDLRLAWCAWKDSAVYLCTPMSLDVNKSGASPLEYSYSLSLKAWRRVLLDGSAFETTLGAPLRRDPNKLARLLNAVQTARRVVQGLTKAAQAAVGDVDRLIFEPLREAALLAKDTLGLGLTLADLPDTLTQRLHESWVQSQGDLRAGAAAAATLNPLVKAVLARGRAAANETKDLVTTRGRLAAAAAIAASPAQKAFAAPKASFDLMETAQLGDLQVPSAVLQGVQQERRRVLGLRRRDWEARRDAAGTAAAALAGFLGAGHATYDATYGVTRRPAKPAPTASDWEALYALNAANMALDAYAATGDAEPSAREGVMQVMAGLARRSGVAFSVPASKFAVPFPYGATLEKLAETYLGDAQRWHEIAALNGLQTPWVDEIGFDLGLAVNGSGNTVVVSDADHLFVGQTAFVASEAARRSRRVIQGLQPSGALTVVTLDGPADLAAYKTADGARLSAFLPDTVNSQGLIYIPSAEDPADDSFVTKAIPGVAEFDPMTAVGGVDLLLTATNQLVVTPDGDTRLAVGLTNIVQNTRIALSVKKGTLLKHPSFGLPLEVGQSIADFKAADVLQAVRRMLAGDPTYTRVDAVTVRQVGGAAAITVAVTIKGTEKPVPISYKVRGDFQTA